MKCLLFNNGKEYKDNNSRSMRLHAGLPKTLWDDAINITTYLINKVPSTLLDYKIAKEV